MSLFSFNFKPKSERTSLILKQISLSFVFKGLSVIINFLLVPLSISYLDTDNYGVWLIITSFIGWFSLFDVGFEHGLRNKFAEAKSLGKDHLARALISSTYYTLASICFVLLLLFLIINFYVDWTKVFNTSPSLSYNLNKLMIVVFVFFFLQLFLKLITTIFTSDQKPSVAIIVNFANQLLSIIGIYFLLYYTNNSLFLFGILFSGIPVLVLIFLNIFAFNTIYKKYKPSFKLWTLDNVKNVFGLGINFFLIQIAAVILYSTDNLIITQLYTPADVVPYNLSFKYFSIITIAFSIIVSPYWSAITEAYAKDEINWIRSSMKVLIKISLVFSVVIIFMIILANHFYVFWVGDEIVIPFDLSIFMGFFVLISLFIQPFVFFINGTGKIRMQLIIGVTMAVINIPLSILLAKYFNFGISGVILATILCSLIGMVFYPIQYFKIINRKAFGIWNK